MVFSHVNRFCAIVPPRWFYVLHSFQASLKIVSQKSGGFTHTNFPSSNQAKESEKTKQFRWMDKMESQLIECLAAYKSRMEYQNKDFDAERPVQYKEIRREIGKRYDDVFRPVCLPYI